jgi:hypothetical protein
VASSDFGTFTGADQTLTTASATNPPPPVASATVGHAKVSGTTALVKVTCTGAPCKLTLKLTAQGRHHHRVGVGSTTVTLSAGQTRVVRISLNRSGRNLLAARHVLHATLIATQSLAGGHVKTIRTQTVIIKIHAHKHH